MMALPDAPYAPTAAASGSIAIIASYFLDFWHPWAVAPDPVHAAFTVVVTSAAVYFGGVLARARDKAKPAAQQSSAGPDHV
jgi:hypothetical protein